METTAPPPTSHDDALRDAAAGSCVYFAPGSRAYGDDGASQFARGGPHLVVNDPAYEGGDDLIAVVELLGANNMRAAPGTAVAIRALVAADGVG